MTRLVDLIDNPAIDRIVESETETIRRQLSEQMTNVELLQAENAALAAELHDSEVRVEFARGIVSEKMSSFTPSELP